MKVLKFAINEKYFDEFKEICQKEEITLREK